MMPGGSKGPAWKDRGIAEMGFIWDWLNSKRTLVNEDIVVSQISGKTGYRQVAWQTSSGLCGYQWRQRKAAAI